MATTEAMWWRGAAIYQVYPWSFADANGDGCGDLRGVTERIPYIASLGVDAIWLSPFFRSPMRDFGYDVSCYTDVDPRFGALADFDALVATAHDAGLKVIIDQVFSHTSDEHDWFRQSRQDRSNAFADWYVWADPKPDGSPPNNWQAVFGGPCWTWDARRTQYYFHNFLAAQPQLNLHNPEVQAALMEAMRFWLDRGVDGVRLDAVNFLMHDPSLRDNPPATTGGPRGRPFDFQHHLYNQSHANIPAFLRRLRAMADGYGERFLVAEVGGERALEEMRLYTAPPELLHSAYSFHYLYADRLTPALVVEGLAGWPDSATVGWPSWAFSNHDAPRAVSRFGGPNSDPTAIARLNLLLLAVLRGNLFLYQGEELGLPQARVAYERLRDPEAIANWPETLGRDGARTPMPWRADAPNAGFSAAEPWLPVDERHAPLAVDRQEQDPGSTLHFARAVLGLRRRMQALRTGSIRVLAADDHRLVLQRGEGPAAVIAAFNLGDGTARWTPPAGLRPLLCANRFDPAAEALGPWSGVICGGDAR